MLVGETYFAANHEIYTETRTKQGIKVQQTSELSRQLQVSNTTTPTIYKVMLCCTLKTAPTLKDLTLQQQALKVSEALCFAERNKSRKSLNLCANTSGGFTRWKLYDLALLCPCKDQMRIKKTL